MLQKRLFFLSFLLLFCQILFAKYCVTNKITHFKIEADTFDFKITSSPTTYTLLRANRFDYKEYATSLVKLNKTNGFSDLRVSDFISINGEAFVIVKPFFGKEAGLAYLNKVKKQTSLSLVLISQYNLRVLLSGRRDYEDYLEFYEDLSLEN